MTIKKFLTAVEQDKKQKDLEKARKLTELAEKVKPDILEGIQRRFPLFYESLQEAFSNAPAAWLNMEPQVAAQSDELGYGHQSCGVVVEGLLISCRGLSDGSTAFYISRFVSQDKPMECLGRLVPLFKTSTLDAQLAKLLIENRVTKK